MNWLRKCAPLMGVACLLGGAVWSNTADASIMYNQDLGGPGVYFGSGNADGDWAVDTATYGNDSYTVQLGLRAKLRQQGLSPSDGSGVYGVFPTGHQTAPPPGRTDRATWNYEFSVLVGNGTTLALSGLTFQLCASDGTNPQECVDPLFPGTNLFGGDNGYVTAGGDVCAKGIGDAGDADCTTANLAASVGQQNSKQLLFGDSPLFSVYDMDAPGLYTFTLTAQDAQGVTVAESQIQAAVPEPATLALFGFGMAGIGFMRRRAKSRR